MLALPPLRTGHGLGWWRIIDSFPQMRNRDVHPLLFRNTVISHMFIKEQSLLLTGMKPSRAWMIFALSRKSTVTYGISGWAAKLTMPRSKTKWGVCHVMLECGSLACRCVPLWLYVVHRVCERYGVWCYIDVCLVVCDSGDLSHSINNPHHLNIGHWCYGYLV